MTTEDLQRLIERLSPEEIAIIQTYRAQALETIPAPITDIKIACRAILDRCPDQYAKAYAQSYLQGLNDARARRYGISQRSAHEELAIRLLFNIKSWRGAEAKAVRAYLKTLV